MGECCLEFVGEECSGLGIISKIGFVSATDPNDRASFSGTHFQMLRGLERAFDQVHVLGPVPGNRFLNRVFDGVNRLLRKATGKQWDFLHSTLFSLYQGVYFGIKARRLGCQALVAPAASTEIAFLTFPGTVVYSPDATFRLLDGGYSRYSALFKWSWRQTDRIEAKAIARADRIVVSSEWARHSVVVDYGYPPDHVAVASYGPNLDSVPSDQEVFRRLLPENQTACRILFLAVDWTRKGGDIALAAFLELLDRGMDAEFLVVGSRPDVSHPRVRVVPSLDKNDPVQYAKLLELILASHFMLVPTRADCTPIAFSEAAGYGIPVVTTDVGGVSSVVRHGESGFVFPLDAPPEVYARAIHQTWQDKEAYARMVQASRRHSRERLNWDAWAARIRDAINEP